MENEPPAIFAQDDGRSSKRGRIMGKLFGRDRKVSNEDRNLNDFLHGQNDPLPILPRPPVLAKLDTSSATRYPNALSVASSTSQGLSLRQRSHSPRIRNKKGLVVRFVDTFPEIIGEGGDSSDIPTQEIAKRKRLRPPPVSAISAPPRPSDILDNPARAFPEAHPAGDFDPLPLKRTQTGYSTISDAPEPEIPAGRTTTTRYLDNPAMPQDEKRKSFIELQQAQMRQAEGLAFANAVRSASSTPSRNRDDLMQPPPSDQRAAVSPVPSLRPVDLSPASNTALRPGTPENGTPRSGYEGSPASSMYSSTASPAQRYPSIRQDSHLSDRERESESSPVKSVLSLHDVVLAAGDEAMATFVARTRHLFELFRLQSETVRPLQSSLPEDLARAGLWWFLKGRMGLESAIRERPTSPQSQQKNEFAKQQAYADLAKGYWLAEEIIPEVLEGRFDPTDGDVEEARRTLGSNLRKLAVSMKRNGILPPEEAFLPQVIDKTIWVEYPSLSRDVVALLWGTSSAALSQMPRPDSGMALGDALPLGDSPHSFCFGRVHTDAFLMEQGIDSHRLYLPCLLSVIRPQGHSNLVFVIASQNGAVQLRIQANKNAGPMWEDVRWRSDSCSIDIRLPRGFILVLKCSQQDYRLLWSQYDFNAKTQATLYPRQDEQCSFRSTVRAFQCFGNGPQARQFPRESVRGCEMAVFERILREGAATGPRNFHRGYRIAVVTGPRSKTISGVNQVYLPQMPVQYGFLRGEQNDPALSLKFENGPEKVNMVMSFNDEKERLQVHSLLVGTALQRDEQVCCDVALQGIRFSEHLGDSASFKALSALPWERARVINLDDGSENPSCVLADTLRVVVESKDGTITDRVNVATGELKMRLDVQNPTHLMIYRHPQADLTVAVTEATVPRELPQGLGKALELLQKTHTVRTYTFPTIADLHRFQTALTGFRVLFDGIASAFAISRRRMVVPIHKKWEAGATRIQVVQQHDGVTQLLAFFEAFTHGECMSFALKGTDVFEAFGKTGKAGIKFDDAKFPLPRSLGEGLAAGGGGGAQEAADAAFVCLDMPELPGEHDDISITFESESDRDKLAKCLPAPVKTSRLSKK